MGWTGTQLDHSRPVTAFEAIEQECGRDFAMRVIRSAKKGKVIYAAVRAHDGYSHPNHDLGSSYVFGLVLLAETRTQREGGESYRELHTKAITEDMGPGENECPAAILDLLSDPPENDYARQWRERCRANLAKREAIRARPKPKQGDTVKFERPLEFTNGDTLDTFTYERGARFTHSGRTYHITKWQERGYEVQAA